MSPPTSDKKSTRPSIYVGLFFVALTTLMYEILLTRIFSVTMWYHFAFMAVSIAMFGMTLGALVVYLKPFWFDDTNIANHLSRSAMRFAMSIVGSFLVYLATPFHPDESINSVRGLCSIAAVYAIISIPFLFSGICVCLVLTRFSRSVGWLYATDLAGAAIGCVLLIGLLELVDGPTAVLVIAFVASVGAVSFSFGSAARSTRPQVLTGCALMAGLIAWHAGASISHSSPFQLRWVKGRLETFPIYEKWNSFSRIAVFGDPRVRVTPRGWGLSPVYPSGRTIRQLGLFIDAHAGTALIGFDAAHPEEVDYLKYDISNFAHHLRSDADVLVIGIGGGRDILSALLFGQRSVTAVEINRNIINALTKKYGDFTGHLDRFPNVHLIHDEARSYVTRQQKHFDIIQVTLIDTWAATAAGAFVLTENSLYTVEGWRTFLDRLSPHGILTFSRMYFKDWPGEMYRLTSLANASLRKLGIKQPRDHIVIVRHMGWGVQQEQEDGVGVILVSRSPLTDEDLDRVKETAERLKFDLVLTPRFALDETFATLASEDNLQPFLATLPLNVAPPTDDNPFFFHMLRLRDAFNPKRWEQGAVTFNMKAVVILGALLVAVVSLTLLCVVVPLVLTSRRNTLQGAGPLLLFFTSIGLGFMLIEISQMQRLIVFLGHPTYGLSVVLFALLLSSGLGSWWTQMIAEQSLKAAGRLWFFLLAVMLVAFGSLTPHVLSEFMAATTPVRIVVAIALLFPLGILMGIPFPLGMRLASSISRDLTPWLWGINGATSVCASVVAVIIALSAGISMAFWVGCGCYALATLAFIRAGIR